MAEDDKQTKKQEEPEPKYPPHEKTPPTFPATGPIQNDPMPPQPKPSK